MADTPVLKDPNVFPSDNVLKLALGKSHAAFDALMKMISDPELGLTHQWNYYKDGNLWLCKICHKKKTVTWLSVWSGYFKLSFYFTEKTAPGVMALKINKDILSAFRESKRTGRLIPLIMEMRAKKHIADALTVMKYKKSLK